MLNDMSEATNPPLHVTMATPGVPDAHDEDSASVEFPEIGLTAKSAQLKRLKRENAELCSAPAPSAHRKHRSLV